MPGGLGEYLTGFVSHVHERVVVEQELEHRLVPEFAGQVETGSSSLQRKGDQFEYSNAAKIRIPGRNGQFVGSESAGRCSNCTVRLVRTVCLANSYLIEHIDPGVLFKQNFNDLRLAVVAGEQERRPAVLRCNWGDQWVSD